MGDQDGLLNEGLAHLARTWRFWRCSVTERKPTDRHNMATAEEVGYREFNRGCGGLLGPPQRRQRSDGVPSRR